jgi:hypothetical protein
MNRYQKCVLVLMLALAGLFFLWDFGFFKKHAAKEDYSNLRVVIDTAARFYIDSVTISASHYNKDFAISRFDSATNTWGFVFDSVKTGTVDITIASLLNTAYTKKINVQSDTSIFIAKADLPAFQIGKKPDIDLLAMQPGEEVTLGMSRQGCFGGFTEKIIVKKKEKGYSVSFFSTRKGELLSFKKELEDNFTDTLAVFQECFRDYFKPKWTFRSRTIQSNYIVVTFRGCTTQSTYIFSKLNSAWKFHDSDCTNNTGYEILLRALQVPWLKEEIIQTPNRIADTSVKLAMKY